MKEEGKKRKVERGEWIEVPKPSAKAFRFGRTWVYREVKNEMEDRSS
jgi:hypothetical protein